MVSASFEAQGLLNDKCDRQDPSQNEQPVNLSAIQGVEDGSKIDLHETRDEQFDNHDCAQKVNYFLPGDNRSFDVYHSGISGKYTGALSGTRQILG
jgi:hypothetical protein